MTSDTSLDSVARTEEIPAFPIASERVEELLAQMTLEEKAAQLVGYWLDQGGEVVAPLQNEMASAGRHDALAEVTRDGIGHYTRVYGTRPVAPGERAAWLWAEQRRLRRETRLGIPALVHEECLTGLAAWKAATFPTPLAWGASFDPALVAEMGALIGESMRTLGIHQGLAPVLDVVRDPRWGRVDECIGEDPYLVGTVGTAYVQGLQSAGVHATLKHFLGYSGSRAGRNHAPVSAGPREIADVFLPPFEMAIRDGGVRSVMNSYAEIDGVPVAADPELLTGVLRERLGFDGVVVADYFAIAFLEVMHAVAADRGDAAELALRAGIDVELPSGDAYREPLIDRVRSGALDEAYLDRAVIRVLAQKEQLGLLDPGAFDEGPPAFIDLDTPRHRDVARRLAAESLVLLSNDGVLPWTRSAGRIALIGPNADRAEALQGCYSFANHVLAHHPDHELGIAIPTVREALAVAVPGAEIVHVRGAEVEGDDRSGFAEAERAAAGADVAIVVVGDQAGLFGRGTVGEGNDVESLDLPGVQRSSSSGWPRPGRPSSWSCSPAGPMRSAGRSTATPRVRRPCCRRSSPARRGPRRSPRCSPAPCRRRVGSRSACRGRPGPSPTATCTRSSGAVGRDLRGSDPAAAVRLRTVVHELRLHRIRGVGRGADRRHVHGHGDGVEHRRPAGGRGRSAVRPGRGRERHPAGRAAAGLCARRAGSRRTPHGALRGAGRPVRVHRSPADAGRRTRCGARVGSRACRSGRAGAGDFRRHGGAIANERARDDRVLPGAATTAGTVALTGGVHEVTAEDARIVTVTIA